MTTTPSTGYGDRIRRARERRNLTQEQLAELLGVSVASINRWEHERSYPRADQRARLCTVLGVSSDDLFPSDQALSPHATPAAMPRENAPLLPQRVSIPADSPFWAAQVAGALDLSDPILKQGRRPAREYFARAQYAAVRAALREAVAKRYGGLAFFGPPMVGKTRMALEALRCECPDFLVLPWPRQEFALSALQVYGGCDVVLLLDDLHELTGQYEAGRVVDGVRRLRHLASGLLVVMTSRTGVDAAATHQRYDGLIEALDLTPVNLVPMGADDAEAMRFLGFVRALAESDPERRLSLDTFDGTPGSVLLGLDRRTTQLRATSFPGAAKAILRALALLRTADIHEYPEVRVRRVAEAVFDLPVNTWTSALDYLIDEGWVALGDGDRQGESQLQVPSDAYVDVCLVDAGIYPRSGRKATSDFPRLYAALCTLPIDVPALFALSSAIYMSRGDRTRSWSELGFRSAQTGLAAVDERRDPILWARGQHILGLSYFQRWEGEQESNTRQAEVALRAAARVLTRERHPADWAANQRALAIAMSTGYSNPTDEMIEESLTSLEACLHVFTREAFPYDWARTHNALGAAWGLRRVGTKSANLRHAIDHYRHASLVFQRENYPEYWALVIRNLGEAYSFLEEAEHAAGRHHRAALACCQQVLDADGIRETQPYD